MDLGRAALGCRRQRSAGHPRGIPVSDACARILPLSRVRRDNASPESRGRSATQSRLRSSHSREWNWGRSRASGFSVPIGKWGRPCLPVAGKEAGMRGRGDPVNGGDCGGFRTVGSLASLRHRSDTRRHNSPGPRTHIFPLHLSACAVVLSFSLSSFPIFQLIDGFPRV